MTRWHWLDGRPCSYMIMPIAQSDLRIYHKFSYFFHPSVPHFSVTSEIYHDFSVLNYCASNCFFGDNITSFQFTVDQHYNIVSLEIYLQKLGGFSLNIKHETYLSEYYLDCNHVKQGLIKPKQR